MAKSLIVNRVNGAPHTIVVPATVALAEAFATSFLEGEYAIYESIGKVGSDVVALPPTMLNLKWWSNENPKDKGFGNVIIPSNKTENDLFAVMKGLTLNGVKADNIEVMTQRVVQNMPPVF